MFVGSVSELFRYVFLGVFQSSSEVLLEVVFFRFCYFKFVAYSSCSLRSPASNFTGGGGFVGGGGPGGGALVIGAPAAAAEDAAVAAAASAAVAAAGATALLPEELGITASLGTKSKQLCRLVFTFA